MEQNYQNNETAGKYGKNCTYGQPTYFVTWIVTNNMLQTFPPNKEKKKKLDLRPNTLKL